MNAQDYVNSEMRSVQGWLTKKAAKAIIDIATVQARLEVRGGACEIGVHHGRLFILLSLLLRADERALAIDLFDNQDENVDGSGQGSLDALIANLRNCGVDLNHVTTLAENSSRITPARIIQSVGPVRLFSVDGGHTEALTYGDLCLAGDTLCQGGLLILDDYMNQRWPGVTEGACRFMRDRPLDVVGFLSNKLIFSKGHAEQYRAVLQGIREEIFGQNAVISRDPNWKERLAATSLWRLARQTTAGRLVSRLSH